jgi:hypothetical protein
MYRPRPKGDGPALARFNQLQVERLTSDVARALGHSRSRNSRVVQAAAYFSLIRSVAPNLAVAQVMIEAAKRQMFSSTDTFQAAHYLPGQLRIDDEFPWIHVPGPTARLRLEYLFADVEHLPASFNKADSAAEGKGLCEAFRQVGEIVLHDPQKPQQGKVNRSLVRRIYDEVWVPGAIQAFGNAVVQKESVNEVPDLEYDEQGNITNLEERCAADWSRHSEVAILQRYAETMRSPPPDLRDDKLLEIERVFGS